MRIGIDARFYGSIGKGLGRYTQKLIENLEKIDAENQYFIFLRKENWNEYQSARGNFAKVPADIPWYGLREQIFLPRIFKKYQLDLMHFPHFNVPIFWKGKFVVTIHDLILLHYPTKRASSLSPLLYFIKKIAYRLVIKRAIRKSEKIITVSEHTKKDIIRYFHIPADKVVVTYEAVDIAGQIPREASQQILAKYGIIKPYILYVGNAYPHKNLERLVLATKELQKKYQNLHLVLVGKEDYFYKRLKKFVADNSARNIIFTDFARDADLGLIYRDATLYIFPSLYEGFGLPPLEAMSKSIPVVSSNATCLPEVLGKAACYFDPRAIGEMAEAIEKVMINSEVQRKLVEAGRNQIKKYSWLEMAKLTKNIYELIK